MKISYRKHFGPHGTVYTQRVRLSLAEWNALYGIFHAEIVRDLPRKKDYILTSGYETYMRMPHVEMVKNRDADCVACLNLTQTRFVCLFFSGTVKHDRNTYLLINTK